MNFENFVATLKETWYLFVVLAALPPIWYLATGNGGVESATVPEANAATGQSVWQANNEGAPSTPFKPRVTSKMGARDAIERYEEFNRKNPDHADVPRNLARMGNLYYSTLGEYEKAIHHYEKMIARYPNFEGIRDIYPNLAACYEKAGKQDLARSAYRRMLEFYPPDSEYYAFAQEELSGR